MEFVESNTKYCLLCLDEIDIQSPTRTIFYNYYYDKYKLFCNCKLNIHPKCMTHWIAVQPRCPICLSNMICCNYFTTFNFVRRCRGCVILFIYFLLMNTVCITSSIYCFYFLT